MSSTVRFDVLTAVLLKIRVSGSAGSDNSRGRRASIFKVTQPKKTWLELYLALPFSVAILGLSLNIRNYETKRNTLPKCKGKVYPVQAIDVYRFIAPLKPNLATRRSE